MRVSPGADDGTVLPDGTALTADALVEGVHFDARLAPGDVGWKAVAVSVSDLAAMGARPQWALLTLSLPDAQPDWVAAFAQGLGEACRHWQVTLAGGDTTGSPGPRLVSLSMGGPCVASPLTRSGGAPGHQLWITGTPGLAGAGWMLRDPGPLALAALRRPEPPLRFALALVQGRLVTAGMDLSDGLAADLPRLAAASGCGARLDEAALPDHPELDALDDATARACRLSGGDDYQLLFTARPAAEGAIRSLAADYGVSVHRIGELTADLAVTASRGPWPAPFDHFGGDA